MNVEPMSGEVHHRLRVRWDAAQSASAAEEALLEAVRREFADAAAHHTEALIALNRATLMGEPRGSVDAMRSDAAEKLAEAEAKFTDLNEQRIKVDAAKAHAEYAMELANRTSKAQPMAQWDEA